MTLTREDYIRAAAQLDCDPAALHAVAEVESNGAGMLPDGRLKILFERHKFHALTRGRFGGKHSDISSSEPGGYVGGAGEWKRFERAARLDEQAAKLATSWGKFQILGLNYAAAGYASVDEMIEDFQAGERAQLDAFINFVKYSDADDELQRLDWAGFARIYNGKAYRRNRYDEKMATQFARLRKEYTPTSAPLIVTVEPVAETVGDSLAPVVPAVPVAALSAALVSESTLAPVAPVAAVAPVVSGPADPPVQVTDTGWRSWIKEGIAVVTGLGLSFDAFFKNNPYLILGGIVVMVVLLILIFHRRTRLEIERMRIASDPSRYNVK